MASALKWDPACLTFPVAIGKAAVQTLRATNSTSNAYTFKVKTTNPKRYSVRPNVGVVQPGQEVTVTVQLPALKEVPADMQKCKDKFQVLTLQLDPKVSEELQTKPEDAKRAELTAIWASDSAKDATVDKIRCAFTYDASYRDAPIPEEEPGQAAPYSPETVPPAAEGASPGGSKTPGLLEREASGAVHDAQEEHHHSLQRGGSSSRQSSRSMDGALEAAALREQLEEAQKTSARFQQRAVEAASQVHSLEKELEQMRKLNHTLEAKVKAEGGSKAAASSGGGGSGGGAGFGSVAMALLFLSGLGMGYLLSPAPRAPVPTARGEAAYKPPAYKPPFDAQRKAEL